MIDQTDADSADAVAATGVRVTVAQTIMKTLGDRTALAQAALDFAAELKG
jgi:hypothetical protein